MIGESREVALGEIIVGEHRVRWAEDDPGIMDLAADIRRHGLIHPLIVRETDQGLLLVAGHRRYTACSCIPLARVPVRIQSGDPQDVRGVVFAENFHRAEVSAVEQAAAIAEAIESGDMSEDDVAGVFRRSADWVRRQVALLGWPQDVLECVHGRTLSIAAASWLAQISDPKYRLFLVGLAADGGATARTTEGWYRGWASQQPLEDVVEGEPVAGPVIPSRPVAESPCYACHELMRPDGMSAVLMCPRCCEELRQAARRAGAIPRPD